MSRPSNRPSFLTSEVHAEALATFIWDAAAELETGNGHGTQTGATVRMARGAAREILTAAGVDPNQVLVTPEPVRTESTPSY